MTIHMTAGTNLTLPLGITRSDVAVNLTGATVWFKARGITTTILRDTEDEGGVTITGALTGQIEIALIPENTSAIVTREALAVQVLIETATRGIEAVLVEEQIIVRPQL